MNQLRPLNKCTISVYVIPAKQAVQKLLATSRRALVRLKAISTFTFFSLRARNRGNPIICLFEFTLNYPGVFMSYPIMRKTPCRAQNSEMLKFTRR